MTMIQAGSERTRRLRVGVVNQRAWQPTAGLPLAEPRCESAAAPATRPSTTINQTQLYHIDVVV